MKAMCLKLEKNDYELLDKIIKKNKYKNKSDAIRECIRRCADKSNFSDHTYEINSKLNRLNHNIFLIRKLQEQFFVNMEFEENLDIKSDKSLKEFLNKNNPYSNSLMD